MAGHVTDDEILRAYRLVLGREPECERNYKTHRSQPDYDTLLKVLMRSNEYRSRVNKLYQHTIVDGQIIISERYDDVFLAPVETFLILALGCALHRKTLNPHYRFCIVAPASVADYFVDAVASCGGALIYDAGNVNAFYNIRTEYLSIHSFGYMDWQNKIIAKIHSEKLGVYADGLKNEYEIPKIPGKEIQRILYFGWEFMKDSLPLPFPHETVPFSDCYAAYDRVASHYLKHKPALSVRQDVPHIQAVFLRYWGKGNYGFREGISMRDAVLKSLEDMGWKEVYLRSDVRIGEVVEREVKEALVQAGYTVHDFGDLFENYDEGLDCQPIEFLLPHLRGISIEAITYDSAVSVSLKILNNATIFLPGEHSYKGLFANERTYVSIRQAASVYQEVCNNIDVATDKFALQQIRR